MTISVHLKTDASESVVYECRTGPRNFLTCAKLVTLHMPYPARCISKHICWICIDGTRIHHRYVNSVLKQVKHAVYPVTKTKKAIDTIEYFTSGKADLVEGLFLTPLEREVLAWVCPTNHMNP